MNLPLPKRSLLVVDRSRFTLTHYRRPVLRVKYKVLAEYRIAVGAEGYRTPAGMYTINTKARCPDWLVPNSPWAINAGLEPGTIVPGCTKENPLKARWLGITDPREGVGIHGTAARDSIGTRASHGCIRMYTEDVKELYNRVPLGTPILIAGRITAL